LSPNLKKKVLCTFRPGAGWSAFISWQGQVIAKRADRRWCPHSPHFSRLLWPYHSPYLGPRLKGVELYLYFRYMLLWCGQEQICLLLSFVKQMCFEPKLLLRIQITDTIRVFDCSKSWPYLVKWCIRFKKHFEFKTVALNLKSVTVFLLTQVTNSNQLIKLGTDVFKTRSRLHTTASDN